MATKKKSAAKQTAKKTVKKVAPKKSASKKAAVKKTAVKKTTVKKSARKKASIAKASQSASAMPAVGSKAPAFKGIDDSGAQVSLAQFSGRPVVVYFYPKDSTPGCTVEACDFRDSMSRLVAAGAAVIGVSRDSVASHVKFKTKYHLNFPLIADEDGKICESFGAWQEKSLYGRKFMGIVRSTFLIDGAGKIAAVWPKVKVDGHVADVLSQLAKIKG